MTKGKKAKAIFEALSNNKDRKIILTTNKGLTVRCIAVSPKCVVIGRLENDNFHTHATWFENLDNIEKCEVVRLNALGRLRIF